ncbi:MAG: hypothetical protein COU85_01900 [Candidatus Portnoybacteria bacterium CG10_big_fil_rev_8_21_14_0_10_44_7]|uniref:Glycosyltransferase 2-like domain-containing protein n=1 Tax=Candidatus Portnoybacteria bacterium CG10_big_fil_rev_8_21_14_0_10_44_7 TaxID=1974816 RepID=A0A2M8KIN5_9BACT|nr:MAG: hypothetical protein COU85_01900 [Candidatus Portnoybacteria bacterium CG10_big_fil_rev_8_21_14_0_10_44_7]
MMYRLFEMLPGLLAWVTLFGVVFISWATPVFAAFFIIAFDLYWFFKTVFLSLHLRVSYNKTKKALQTKWFERLQAKFPDAWPQITHLVILPFYNESWSVLNTTLTSFRQANYDLKKIMIVLGAEQRGGRKSLALAEKLKQKYAGFFGDFLITVHPDNITGELAGKGSNENWMGQQAQKKLVDKKGLDYKKVVVSVFDADTQIYPEYFGCLTWHYLRVKKPHRCSFQPIPVFHNNIWDAPSFSRVAGLSCTFWQMMQQARQDRLTTFSSQALSFRGLVDMDFWTPKNVSEDSRVFWKALLAFDGRYRVVPLHYPVSMDANLAVTYWQTTKNVYKQQRRWAWGAENVAYLLFGSLKNKKFPRWQKIKRNFEHIEGFWSWPTNALMIFLLGWLPLALGGQEFNQTALAYNLPKITRWIMTFAMVGIISSIIYSLSLVPKKPRRHGKRRYVWMVLQWFLIPINLIIFGSLPALDAQTRLLFGRYMGFWVTPKERRGEELFFIKIKI